ncbi:MAG: DUF58 domain-containing protein [Pseudomonadota bacterium]
MAVSPSSEQSAENNEARVRVTQSSLIRLRQRARHLSLDALRLRARKGGNYLSHFKGRGMEFDETRQYQDGDDPRTIDWRVTARTGKVYTKLFREERERPVFCWVDLRTRMQFATRGRFKSVMAAEMAALLSWAAVQRGDRLGGFVFNDHRQSELRPALGHRAALRMIHQLALLDEGTDGESDVTFDESLSALRRVVHPGSLVVLMSDFSGLSEDGERHLAELARHNDVLMLAINDPLERTLPPPGTYPVVVGGRRRLLRASTASRRAWQSQFDAQQDALSALASRNAIRWQVVSTDEEPLAVMQALMGKAR